MVPVPSGEKVIEHLFRDEEFAGQSFMRAARFLDACLNDEIEPLEKATVHYEQSEVRVAFFPFHTCVIDVRGLVPRPGATDCDSHTN